MVAFVLVAAVLPPVFCHLKKTRLHCPPPRSAEELMHTLILNHIMHTLILHTLNSYQGVTDDNPIHARAGCEIMTAISCMCSPFQKLELKYTSEKILDSPFHLMS